MISINAFVQCSSQKTQDWSELIRGIYHQPSIQIERAHSFWRFEVEKRSKSISFLITNIRNHSFDKEMALLQRVTTFYYDIIDNKSDPRVNDWPLMGSPLPILFICCFYALFVKLIGPKLMENRKPFDLRRVMIYYNTLQVVFSAWLWFECLRSGWLTGYSYRCEPVDYSNTPKAIKVAFLSYIYFISKIVELFDTIAFVLRKKDNNISTLHVYHHGSMPFVTWIGVKFVPGGNSTFFALLNTFVHTIMYGYYLLAAFGPHMQPYLWWKKYLTSLQLIQFGLILIHSCQLFFIECDYPIVFAWLTLAQAFIFLILFGNFYVNSYESKKVKTLGSASSFETKNQ